MPVSIAGSAPGSSVGAVGAVTPPSSQETVSAGLLNTPVVEGVFEGIRALFDLAGVIFKKRSFLEGWP
jgi:hypothetical protein